MGDMDINMDMDIKYITRGCSLSIEHWEGCECKN